jgi:hypothetical protein
VIRFHIIAAVTAAANKFKVIISGFITPLPIVVATLRGNIRKARKLKVAASPTAARGERTFVETTVAIELAESWKPLIKSNTRTSAIIKYKNVILNPVIN